jgi:hypothetical protein
MPLLLRIVMSDDGIEIDRTQAWQTAPMVGKNVIKT